MEYKDSNGSPIKWRPKNKPRATASKNHTKALEIVSELIPGVQVFQECKIPTKTTLFIDIYIPAYLLAIEVDGGQHDAYNPFFHKDQMAFFRSRKNDIEKEKWCETNDITLIRLKENNERQWREQITSFFARNEDV